MSCPTTSTQPRSAAAPARGTGNVVRDIRDLPRVTQGRIAQRLSAVPTPTTRGRQAGGGTGGLRPMRRSA